jgi:hypothetical protein
MIAEEIIIHPCDGQGVANARGSQFNYDVALIRIGDSSAISQIPLIPFHTPEMHEKYPAAAVAGVTSTITGWGHTSYGAVAPLSLSLLLPFLTPLSLSLSPLISLASTGANRVDGFLRTVEVPIVSQTTCTRVYSRIRLDVTYQMLCAGDIGVGKAGSCQGGKICYFSRLLSAHYSLSHTINSIQFNSIQFTHSSNISILSFLRLWWPSHSGSLR